MSGRLNGVASRIQNDQANIHCAAHSLNFCLQHCGRNCACIQDALGVTTELATLIRASLKRLALFYHLRDQLSPGSSGLNPLCPTQWTVCSGSVDAVLKNYIVLCEELAQTGADSCSEYSTKALGLLALMEKFTPTLGSSSHILYLEPLSTVINIAIQGYQYTGSFIGCQCSIGIFASI